MDSSGSELHPVQQLADEFIERQRRGERPTLDEYAERYPALAEEIREVFPALLMMDEIAPADSDLQVSRTTKEPDHAPQKQIADYRILREIGRGGMGVVYEAEQESLGRRVALKVLLREMAANDRSMQRFQREARAAARMHHTNIVPVFEVGKEGDTAFYVMQLIQGQGLDLVIDDLKRLRREHSSVSGGKLSVPPSRVAAPSIAASLISGKFRQEDLAVDIAADPAGANHEPNLAFTDTVDQTFGSTASAALPGESEISTAETNRSRFHRSVAQIALQTADALAYAHARGIIHRDIKPSNLILDAGGVVWVTDFGLAKTDDEAMTHTGDILGTMRYMSPERFQGQCDVRADVYSLGLTLYELLVLKPAFESPDRLKLIEMVRQSEPPTPRSIDPRIPRDLETIVLKSIDKDPKRRYQSADELSDDLRRFVEDQPIRARRISIPERFVRWSRRNKAVAASLTTIALLLLIVAVGSSISARLLWESAERQRGLRVTEERARKEAENARSLEEQQRREAERQQREAERQRAVAEQRQYNTEIQLARNEIEDGNFGSADETLRGWVPSSGQRDLRHWEWYYLLQRAQEDVLSTFYGHDGIVWGIAWSPDSRRCATCSIDGVRVWHTPSGKLDRELNFTGEVHSIAWGAVSDLLAVRLRDGSIHLFDGATYQPSPSIASVPSPFGGISFSHDGRFIGFLSAENSAVIFDHANRRVEWSIETTETDPVFDICWSPVGNQFAVISAWHAEIYELHAKQLICRINAEILGRAFRVGAWSHDGRTIAVRSTANSVGIFDARMGQLLSKLPVGVSNNRSVRHNIHRLNWSPDGTRIVTAGAGNALHLWDAKTYERLRTLHGHSETVHGAAWSPDGQRLASVSADGTARIWKSDDELDEGARLQGHDRTVLSVGWSPDGTFVASAAADNTVRVWEINSRECLHVMEGHDDVVEHVAWCSDGQRVATASHDKTVAIWDVGSGQRIRSIDHDAPVKSVAWSPDGLRLVSTSSGGKVQIWDPSSGKLIRHLAGHIEAAYANAWSPSGQTVASAGSRGVWIWEVATGEAILRHPSVNRDRRRRSLAFSPDGKLLAWPEGQTLFVFDLDLKHVTKFMRGHSSTISGLGWSPDSRRLVTSSNDGTVRIWDPEQSQELMRLSDAGAPVASVAWSPDGQQILGGLDQAIRIWSANEGYRTANAPNFFDGQAMTRSRRARQLLDEGILGPAELEFTGLLTARPDDWSVWEARGKLYVGLGKWELAASDYRRALDLAPENGVFSLLIDDALLRLKQGDVQSYWQDCRRLLQVARNNESLRLDAAQICAVHPDTHRKVDGVEELYRQVYRMQQGDQSYIQIGRLWVALRLGMHHEVLENRSIEFQWRFQEGAFEGGLVLIDAITNAHLGRHDGARAAMDRATEIWETMCRVGIEPFWRHERIFDIVYHEARELVDKTRKSSQHGGPADPVMNRQSDAAKN